LKNTVITLQILRLKLETIDQTGKSSESIMQLLKTIFLDLAVFMEETKTVVSEERSPTVVNKKHHFMFNVLVSPIVIILIVQCALVN
jgi:hypothetical protein